MSELLSPQSNYLLIIIGALSASIPALFQLILNHYLKTQLEMTKLTHTEKLKAYTDIIRKCEDHLEELLYDEGRAYQAYDKQRERFELLRDHYAFIDKETIEEVEELIHHYLVCQKGSLLDLDQNESLSYIQNSSRNVVIDIRKRSISKLTGSEKRWWKTLSDKLKFTFSSGCKQEHKTK